MNEKKAVKLIIVFYLIVAIFLFPNENQQFGTKEVVSSDSKAPVVKLNGVENKQPISGILDTTKVEEILLDTRLEGATTAISIRQASNGEIIYAHLGDVRVRPASVMKLLTGAAALEALDEKHTFKTELYTDGEVKNGILQGSLYIRGQGDPTLKEEDLNQFVAQLKTIGIKGIDGDIYGDDSWYDADRLSQDLNWSDESNYTGAQVSALTVSPNEDYDAGTVIVEVYPAATVGDAATIRTVPETDYIEIVNKTETTKKDSTNQIKVERAHGSNRIAVSGTIPLGFKKARAWASVWEPTDYVLSLLKKNLTSEGIYIVPTSQMSRKKVPEGATLLASKESMPLKELFIPFMKLSNNGHGEVLVKEMGRVMGGEGSWYKGLSVMGKTLAQMGIDMESLLLRDGSGMSHKTLVTANEVTKLLHIVQTKSWYPTFSHSLPVAGHDERLVGGTLRYRMKGTVAEGHVTAKTGTLNGVTSLSGYVQTKNSGELIFSIIVNNHLDETTDTVIDQLAVEIAGW